MNELRRLSRQAASDAATAMARSLVEATDLKGWTCEPSQAVPDAIGSETVGKTPRYWIVHVRYTRDGAVLDGPGLIRIDLLTDQTSWLESL